METVIKGVSEKEIKQLVQDVTLIKNILISQEETELSDWAKKELAEARKIPRSKCISHEEVEKLILER